MSSVSRQIRQPHNYFKTRRKQYSTALVQGKISEAAKIEEQVIGKLQKNLGKVGESFSDPSVSAQFRTLMRQGIDVSYAVKIAALRNELTRLVRSGAARLPSDPKYRKPSILRLERHIVKLEYLSFKKAFKNSVKFGLKNQKELRAKVEEKGKKLAEYEKVFRTRLRS